MADELNILHDYASGILTQLSSNNRTILAREIAKRLRENNRKRIIAQHQPDGTSFEPRKQQKFRKKGAKLGVKCLQNYAQQNFCAQQQTAIAQQCNLLARSPASHVFIIMDCAEGLTKTTVGQLSTLHGVCSVLISTTIR